MVEKILTMKLLKEKYGVCRLDKTELIPKWAQNSEIFSITRTSDELSIVCIEDSIPNDIKCEKDWRILKIEGPLSIFAISTYDTDYILVKNKDIDNAVESLIKERYEVVD